MLTSAKDEEVGKDLQDTTLDPSLTVYYDVFFNVYQNRRFSNLLDLGFSINLFHFYGQINGVNQ